MSRACAWADLDGDLLPELIVANARVPNLLLRNHGDLGFAMDTTSPLSDDGGYSYGVSAADFDDDGALDIFVANFDGPNALLRGSGTGALEPVDGAPESAASKGHSWGDFDGDGRLDLYLGSGTPAPDMFNALYLGEGPDGFRSYAGGVIGLHADTSAAVAAADIDADGDLDLFVANWGSGGSADRLYRNTSSGTAWLKVALSGAAGGLGARIEIEWTDRGQIRTSHRHVTASTGYAGQDAGAVHFGLGAAESVAVLVIHWPSGCVDRRTDVGVRQVLTVREGACGPE